MKGAALFDMGVRFHGRVVHDDSCFWVWDECFWYNVTFPMLSKVVVKGKGITPLYQHLTSKETNPKFGGDIQWNFTKFLVSRDGEIVNRFEPRVSPDSAEMKNAIEAELAKK